MKRENIISTPAKKCACIVKKQIKSMINLCIKNLEDKDLVAFKYCDENGLVSKNSNPNGSSNSIAGILNIERNILGMMPHPERLIDPMLSGEDGSVMFRGLLSAY